LVTLNSLSLSATTPGNTITTLIAGLFFFLRHGLTMQPWLAYFCLQSIGIIAVWHRAQLLAINFKNYISNTDLSREYLRFGLSLIISHWIISMGNPKDTSDFNTSKIEVISWLLMFSFPLSPLIT
jgi:hypothetical protein